MLYLQHFAHNILPPAGILGLHDGFCGPHLAVPGADNVVPLLSINIKSRTPLSVAVVVYGSKTRSDHSLFVTKEAAFWKVYVVKVVDLLVCTYRVAKKMRGKLINFEIIIECAKLSYIIFRLVRFQFVQVWLQFQIEQM